MENKALRYNQGKLRFDLIAPEMDLALAKVLTYGATKYKDRNWEMGLPITNYLASAKRHLNKFELGEDIDEESGLKHIECLFTNIGMLLTTLERFNNLDDRPCNDKSR